MTKREPRSCVPAFGLMTVGLFLFAACYVVDGYDDDDSHRRCRSAGVAVSLVAAVEGRGGGSGGKGSGAKGSETAERPTVDTRKRDRATAAAPSTGDRLRKDPRRSPSRHVPDAATPTPSPSRTGGCKGTR
jgi:hypothetical protein